MAVTKLPGFYDYLGQGVSQFSDNLVRRQQQQLAQKNAILQFMANQHAAGSLPTESFQAWVAQNKIPGLEGFKPGKSPFERKEEFISQIPSLEDQEAARAQSYGLTPPADAAIARRTARAGATTAEANATYATDNAAQANAQARLATGDKTSQQYDEAAKRYIGGMIQGGRIDPKQAKTIVDGAIKKYMTDRQNSRIGVIPDSEIPILRAHFENALNDAMLEQRKMDIQMTAASNRPGDDDRMFQRLATIENNIGRRAQMLLSQISGPDAIVNKAVDKATYDKLYKQYVTEIERTRLIRNAMATLDPGDIRKALQAAASAEDETIADVEGRYPGAGGPARAQGPGVGRPGGQSSGAPAMKPEEYQAAKKMLEQIPADKRGAFLDQKKAQGKISEADYSRLKSELKIK